MIETSCFGCNMYRSMRGTKLPLPLFFNFLFTYLFSIIFIPYYISFSFINILFVSIYPHNLMTTTTYICLPQGRIQGGAHPAPPPLPPKIGKNMNFWRKIVIFHTKYPKIFAPPFAWRNFFKCYLDGGNLSDYPLVSSNLSYTFSERSQNNQSSENNQMKNKNYI